MSGILAWYGGPILQRIDTFVTLNVTFRFKGQGGILPSLFPHTSFDKVVETLALPRNAYDFLF